MATIPNGAKVAVVTGTVDGTGALCEKQATDCDYLVIQNLDDTDMLLVSFDKDHKRFFSIPKLGKLEGPFSSNELKQLWFKASAGSVDYCMIWAKVG